MAGILCGVLVLAPLGPARAFFTDPWEVMRDLSINMLDAMLRLSDDIGLMADRIGEMADRIVDTEGLLADTLLQLNGSVAGGGEHGVLLLAPMTGMTVNRVQAPDITLSNGGPNAGTAYLLYVADSPTFDTPRTVPLLVNGETDPSVLWQTAMQVITGDTAYLAVRSIDAEQRLSGLSNAVRVTLQ